MAILHPFKGIFECHLKGKLKNVVFFVLSNAVPKVIRHVTLKGNFEGNIKGIFARYKLRFEGPIAQQVAEKQMAQQYHWVDR